MVGNAGGPRYSYLYPVIYLYTTMFTKGQVNYAAAIGYVVALILFIITTLQRDVFMKERGEELA
jgi:lactose/L-arabinose transport system permease protein/arabinosaccharide transport system permease protein